MRFSPRQLARGRGQAPPPAPPSGAYDWYPALDLDIIPFNVAAGDWGAQNTVKVATGPTTTSTGTAGTPTQLIDACNTPGTEVTLSDDIDGASVSTGNITDVVVVVPTDAKLLRPIFGRATAPFRQITRLHIRGDVAGTFGGGQSHQMRFFGPIDDLVIGGFNASGPGGNNGAINIQKNSGGACRRLAIHNMRGNCGGYFLLCNIDDPVIAGCSVLTAQDTVTPVEAWGFRFSRDTLGNVIEFGNDVRASTARLGLTNNVYHRSRRHPNPGALYSWAYGNTYVDRVESRIFLIDAAFGGGTGILNGAWFQQNLVIATGGIPDCQIKDAAYGRITDNTFQSDEFLSSANLNLGPLVTDGVKTPNTFEALPGSDPAWGAAGDPSSIDWTV